MTISGLTRNNSFFYENNGDEGKIKVSVSESRGEHILTTYSPANTPDSGQLLQQNSPLHKVEIHFGNDPNKTHFHKLFSTQQDLLNAISTTELEYEVNNITSLRDDAIRSRN